MGAAAVGAVTAGLGLLDTAEKDRQAQQKAQLAALQTQLSGLSGSGIQAGTLPDRPSKFQGALTAGLAGFSVAQKNQGKSLFGGAQAEQNQPAQPEATAQPAAEPNIAAGLADRERERGVFI